jgi:hypothetical protein
MLGKPCNQRAADVKKLVGLKTAQRSRPSSFRDSKDRGRYCFLPAFSQPTVSLAFIPVSLLHNIGDCRIAKDNPLSLHPRRARSRNAATRPFLRISVTESSILGPFAAMMRSCSRLDKRRSLSWRISSRTYSLGVPQSPEATWHSTYFLSASGSEMLRDVIAIPSYYDSL